MAKMNGNIGTVTVSVCVDLEPSEQFDAVAKMLGYVKERTCTILKGEGEYSEFSLSCGHYVDGARPNYCPDCGAKVME